MIKDFALLLARLALATNRGRRVLTFVAQADDEAAMALFEQLAARFKARVEIRE